MEISLLLIEPIGKANSGVTPYEMSRIIAPYVKRDGGSFAFGSIQPQKSPCARSLKRFRAWIKPLKSHGPSGWVYVKKIEGLEPSHLRPLILSHGWINLPPFNRVEDGFAYSFSLGELPVTILVRTSRTGIDCHSDSALTRAERVALSCYLDRILSLDFPHKSFQDLCRRKGERALLVLARKGWGRMLRAATPWEDAVKTLLTTNASWPYTVQMCRDLVMNVGEITSSGSRTFPTARRLKAFLDGGYASRLKIGYRIRYLASLVASAQNADSWLNEPMPTISKEDVTDRVLGWKGFGRYAAAHFLMLLGLHSFLPVDREVAKHLKIPKGLSRARVDELKCFSDWGDFRFTAYKTYRVLSRKNWIGD